MTLSDLVPWKRNEKAVSKSGELEPILSLRDEINRMFDNFFDDPWSLRPFEMLDNSLTGFSPRLDVNETDKDITVAVELPGMEQKDVNVSIGNGVMTISGEKRTESKDKGSGYYRAERSFGSFQRQIPLSAEVFEDDASAIFKNGVLTISVPKKQTAAGAGKKILIKKG